MFKDLVIARIVEPTSKADTVRVLDDLGADTLSYQTIQRHLAMITPGGYRDVIADRCFDHAAETGGLSLILYDVTTLYFEAEKDLDTAGCTFIVGSRVTRAPGDLASHFHWHGDLFADGQIIDTVTPRHGRSLVNDVKKRVEPVWNPATDTTSWQTVWTYSRKRAAHDEKTLNAQEARARGVVDGGKAPKSTRFVKTTAKGRTLDEASLDRARSLVGLKGYVTNLPAVVMDSGEVIAKYHDLWRVEQSFRMSKTDLRARPIFHRTRAAIEAHLTIVFAALAVSRVVQQRTGLVAIGRAVKTLRPLRTATIVINGVAGQFPPEIPPGHREVLDKIGPEVGH